MSEEEKKPWFLIVPFLILIGVFVYIYFDRYRRAKEMRDHPGWAVGHFLFFAKAQKGARTAEYSFEANGETWYASGNEYIAENMGSRLYSTCFPVLYSTIDPSNSCVMMTDKDLEDAGVQLPDSVNRLVSAATFKQRFKVRPYPYPGLMIGGYSIVFGFDENSEYLSLLGPRGDTIKSRLTSVEMSTPYRKLGYVIADFTDFFVIARVSREDTAVRRIQLFEKVSGAPQLDEPICWIGADVPAGCLLYYVEGGPVDKQKIVLYNVVSRKKEYYPYPPDLAFGHRLRLASVTDTLLTMKYTMPGEADVFWMCPRTTAATH